MENLSSVEIEQESFFSALKKNALSMIGLWGSWLFDAMDASLYAFAIPFVVQDFNVTLTKAVSVVSIFLLCTALGGIFIGNISDRLGRKTTVLLSIVIYGLSNFLVGQSSSWLQLAIYRGLAGFAVGGLWPAAAALISEIWPAKSRGGAVSLLQTGWAFGALLAALFAKIFIPMSGWRGMFLATLVPAVIVFVYVIFFVKESPVWKENIKLRREEEAKESKHLQIEFFMLFNQKNIKNTLLGLLVSILGMYGWWTLYTFLPSYIDSTLKIGIGNSATFMIWTNIGNVFGYGSFGFLADKWGRRRMFSIFFVAMALIIPLFIYSITTSGTTYLIWVSLILGYFTGYFGGYGSWYSELFSTEVRSTAAGFCFNGGRAAIFAGPVLITALIPKIGFSLAIGTASLSYVLAAILVFTLQETKGKVITVKE